MKRIFFFVFFFVLAYVAMAQQRLTLEECIVMAEKNNIDIQQMKQSLKTRQYRLQAAKLRKLPDLDVLGGYTYQSDPIKINLQSVKEGIVKGTAQQNVDAANRVYKEITGQDLSSSAKDAIYGGAADIINGIYPNYNPSLSKQQYFTAGLSARIPIYLGGKLRAVQNLAQERVNSGKINIQFTKNTVFFRVITQYLKIQYLNAVLDKQEQLLEVYKKTKGYAQSMVDNEIIPPYQAHWASVTWTQAKVGYQKFVLEKENAVWSLKEMLGVDSSYRLKMNSPIVLAADPTLHLPVQFWDQNPSYQWLKSKMDVARVTEKVTKSASYPNVFGLANYQFLRKDLPLITPPWMIGIGLQWNIFSSLENQKKVKAAHSFYQSSRMMLDKKKKTLQKNVRVARNKLKDLRQQVIQLDNARKEAAHTTEMIRKRMKNKMSSVKNVNDALKVQLEAEKAYYSTVMAYDLAAAVYLNMQGKPKEIVDYLK